MSAIKKPLMLAHQRLVSNIKKHLYGNYITELNEVKIVNNKEIIDQLEQALELKKKEEGAFILATAMFQDGNSRISSIAYGDQSEVIVVLAKSCIDALRNKPEVIKKAFIATVVDGLELKMEDE